MAGVPVRQCVQAEMSGLSSEDCRSHENPCTGQSRFSNQYTDLLGISVKFNDMVDCCDWVANKFVSSSAAQVQNLHMQYIYVLQIHYIFSASMYGKRFLSSLGLTFYYLQLCMCCNKELSLNRNSEK